MIFIPWQAPWCWSEGCKSFWLLVARSSGSKSSITVFLRNNYLTKTYCWLLGSKYIHLYSTLVSLQYKIVLLSATSNLLSLLITDSYWSVIMILFNLLCYKYRNKLKHTISRKQTKNIPWQCIVYYCSVFCIISFYVSNNLCFFFVSRIQSQ